MPEAVTALISIGSNVGDRRANILTGCSLLSASTGLSGLVLSGIIETRAVGRPQPDFLNAAARFDCTLSPFGLLELCMRTERALGRVRDPNDPHGPRELDLDIVLFGSVVLNAPGLVIPHPEFRRRRFVLLPAAEIAAELTDPVTGRTIGTLLKELENAEGRA
jgi:2-amino-4-hydroxy-6-hydroxymethyldihydropteridine diphosphokinase